MIVDTAALDVPGVAAPRAADAWRRELLHLHGFVFTAWTLLACFALTDLFVVAGLVNDRVTRGRVHPAYWWGGGLLLAFATWLTR